MGAEQAQVSQLPEGAEVSGAFLKIKLAETQAELDALIESLVTPRLSKKRILDGLTGKNPENCNLFAGDETERFEIIDRYDALVARLEEINRAVVSLHEDTSVIASRAESEQPETVAKTLDPEIIATQSLAAWGEHDLEQRQTILRWLELGKAAELALREHEEARKKEDAEADEALRQAHERARPVIDAWLAEEQALDSAELTTEEFVQAKQAAEEEVEAAQAAELAALEEEWRLEDELLQGYLEEAEYQLDQEIAEEQRRDEQARAEQEAAALLALADTDHDRDEEEDGQADDKIFPNAAAKSKEGPSPAELRRIAYQDRLERQRAAGRSPSAQAAPNVSAGTGADSSEGMLGRSQESIDWWRKNAAEPLAADRSKRKQLVGDSLNADVRPPVRPPAPKREPTRTVALKNSPEAQV